MIDIAVFYRVKLPSRSDGNHLWNGAIMRKITNAELVVVSGGAGESVFITAKKSNDTTAATAVSISKGSFSAGSVGGGARTLSGTAQIAACTDMSNQAVQACIDSTGCDLATSKEDKANIKANTYSSCMTAINKQIGK